MRVPMGVLKLTVRAPALLFGVLVGLFLVALIPGGLGVLLIPAGGALLGVLAFGGLEAQAVRLLTRSRPASKAELAGLGPALESYGGLDLPGNLPPQVYVRTAARPQTPVALRVGHSSLVVTPWLIEALARSWVSVEEATALVLAAEGQHRAVGPRLEVAVMAVSVPWRMLAAVGSGVGRVFAWFPFMRLAWAMRGVVGVVAVVQSAMDGRAPFGLLAGGFVALTYLVPAASRAFEARLEAAGDRLVVTRGLGGVLASLMRRYRLPAGADRLHLLENGTPAARGESVLVPVAFSPN